MLLLAEMLVVATLASGGVKGRSCSWDACRGRGGDAYTTRCMLVSLHALLSHARDTMLSPAHTMPCPSRGCSPPSEEALRAWLLLRDVDLSLWGRGPCKSVRDLFHEVRDLAPLQPSCNSAAIGGFPGEEMLQDADREGGER
jgi:hypothetical protein